MGMNIVCLDLEGVLAPEIWVAFAEKAGIPDLMRTTRDEPDYDKLMQFRLDVLRRHGMGLPQIQEVIADIQPVPGAKEFLDDLRAQTQVSMIKASKAGFLFRSTVTIKAEHPEIPAYETFEDLSRAIKAAL